MADRSFYLLRVSTGVDFMVFYQLSDNFAFDTTRHGIVTLCYVRVFICKKKNDLFPINYPF
jgi:hypothetical protein